MSFLKSQMQAILEFQNFEMLQMKKSDADHCMGWITSLLK